MAGGGEEDPLLQWAPHRGTGADDPVVWSLIVVHSPLLGPSSLRPLAQEAEMRGRAVFVPDLTSTVSSVNPVEAYVTAAAEAAQGLEPPVVIVAHSGAGAFLPSIAGEVGPGTAQVFVDAVLPPPIAPHRTDDWMWRLLSRHSVGGQLRPWLEWWPPEVVDRLVPDPEDRKILAADAPRVPLSFYEHEVPMPSGWTQGRCGYVRLSAAYDDEGREAVERAWPVVELDSTHLAPYTHPDLVLEAITEVAGRLWR